MTKQSVYGVTITSDVSQALWPLHRSPGPSKKSISVNEKSSLLEQAVGVFQSLIPFEQRWIVTYQDQLELEQRPPQNLAQHVLIQPYSKGTAAALLQACFQIQQHDPEAVIVVVPTDIYIPDPQRCVAFISHAIDYAQTHKQFVLLGVKALYPSPEHGYIAYQQTQQTPYPITFFHEQPGENLGLWYEQEGAFWNSKIMAVQVGVFTEICRQQLPLLYDTVYQFLFEYGSFDLIPESSLEKDLLEKVTDAVVLPADFPWCSLHSLESFLAAKQHSAGEQNVISIDAKNNLVEARDSLVALVGVENLCIVQSDDILLVINRDQLDKVKLVLEMLKKNQNEEYL